MASGSLSDPSVGAAYVLARRRQEGSGSLVSGDQDRLNLGFGERGPATTPAPALKGEMVHPQARPGPALGRRKRPSNQTRFARSYLRAGHQLGLILLPGTIAVWLRRRLRGLCTRSRFQAWRRRGLRRLRLLRPRGPRPLAPARAAARPAPPPSHAAACAAPSLHSLSRRHRRRRSPRRTTANMAAPGSPSAAASRSEGTRSPRRRTSPRSCLRHFE